MTPSLLVVLVAYFIVSMGAMVWMVRNFVVSIKERGIAPLLMPRVKQVARAMAAPFSLFLGATLVAYFVVMRMIPNLGG